MTEPTTGKEGRGRRGGERKNTRRQPYICVWGSQGPGQVQVRDASHSPFRTSGTRGCARRGPSSWVEKNGEQRASRASLTLLGGGRSSGGTVATAPVVVFVGVVMAVPTDVANGGPRATGSASDATTNPGRRGCFIHRRSRPSVTQRRAFPPTEQRPTNKQTNQPTRHSSYDMEQCD